MPEIAAPRPRVLVVDDEPVLRDLCCLTVANLLHADAEPFPDAQSALARLRQQPTFNLLLLDYMLPDLDGPTLCREARKLTAVPIIILTASEDVDGQMRAAGADQILRKPISPAALAGVLRPLLRTNSPVGALTTPADIKADYTRSLPAQADALEEQLKIGDCKGVQRIAHKVKGTSGTFGLLDVMEAASALNAALKPGGAMPTELVLVLCAVLRARGAERQ